MKPIRAFVTGTETLPRRAALEAPRLVPLPEGVADLARGEVRFRNGHRCELSEREAELLRYLAAHAGRTVSRDEILEKVWRLNPARTITRTIDMHVANLRGKLRDDAQRPRVLLTVRGSGYMLSPDGEGEGEEARWSATPRGTSNRLMVEEAE
jgi:DNA-binding response OmpR family regulator